MTDNATVSAAALQKEGWNPASHAGKYLTLVLASESYGINILKIREIIGVQDITRVPDSLYFMKGVINLRGQVIAVIDLRLRFGMEEKEYTEETCIIIVERQDMLTGLIVDRVDEVLDFTPNDLEPPPKMGTGNDDEFIQAMGKTKTTVVMLLNSDLILKNERMRLGTDY
ncbi:TPA: chemotaxis protein CheW [Candidatus Sumerlaeota bacterium]|jgi:purine-binding chemotaxis protein CheW|nr:chemotaxis protein CheW [Candidatus Sumerlaeota bacterium]